MCIFLDRGDRTSYTISKKDGIDVRFLISITDQYGSIDKQKAQDSGYTIEESTAWLSKEADVLIPAALEGQINAETVEQINKRVKIIAEGANGPTMPEADDVIKGRNIFLIPDFLCNSGGVTVSYFEGVQNDMNYYWHRDEVLEKLDTKMTSAFEKVLNMSQQENVYMRDAAYMVAIASVVKAMELRGWI